MGNEIEMYFYGVVSHVLCMFEIYSSVQMRNIYQLWDDDYDEWTYFSLCQCSLGFLSFRFDKHKSEPLRPWLMEVSPCFDKWCSRQQHLPGYLNVLTNHGLQIPEIS